MILFKYNKLFRFTCFLQRRRNHIMVMAIVSCTALIFSAISLYVQQDFIYQISEQIRQLHIPFAVDGDLKAFLHQPDYVWNLLSWFGWLFLKNGGVLYWRIYLYFILKESNFSAFVFSHSY